VEEQRASASVTDICHCDKVIFLQGRVALQPSADCCDVHLGRLDFQWTFIVKRLVPLEYGYGALPDIDYSFET